MKVLFALDNHKVFNPIDAKTLSDFSRVKRLFTLEEKEITPQTNIEKKTQEIRLKKGLIKKITKTDFKSTHSFYHHTYISKKNLQNRKFTNDPQKIFGLSRLLDIVIVSDEQSLLGQFDSKLTQFYGMKLKKMFIRRERNGFTNLIYRKNDVGIITIKMGALQNKKRLKYLYEYTKNMADYVLFVIMYSPKNRKGTVCLNDVSKFIYSQFNNDDKIHVLTCGSSLTSTLQEVLIDIIYQRNTIFYLNPIELNSLMDSFNL